MSENTFWVSLAAIIICVIICCAINTSQNNVLISEQTTCYGKLLQSNGNSSDITMQLQACGGK